MVQIQLRSHRLTLNGDIVELDVDTIVNLGLSIGRVKQDLVPDTIKTDQLKKGGKNLGALGVWP